MKAIAFMSFLFLFPAQGQPISSTYQPKGISVTGKWTMCKSARGAGKNESVIMANICTTWLFKPDHSGVVGLIRPNYPINWKTVGDTLYISNKKGTDFIRSGAYSLTEERIKTGRSIILTNSTKDTRYFLVQ